MLPWRGNKDDPEVEALQKLLVDLVTTYAPWEEKSDAVTWEKIKLAFFLNNITDKYSPVREYQISVDNIS
jgi:hypothetical protein